MGKKVNWFCAVKKAVDTEDCKEHKDQRSSKKKKWFVKKKKKSSLSNTKSSTTNNNITNTTAVTTVSVPLVAVAPIEAVKPLPILPPENVKIIEEEDEQKKHAESIAVATAKAAEAAVAAAQAAAEVVRLTNAAQIPAKPKEDAAAKLPAKLKEDAAAQLPAKPKEDAAAQLPAKLKEDAAAKLPAKPKEDAAAQLPAKPKEDAAAKLPAKPKEDAAAQLPGTPKEDAAAQLPEKFKEDAAAQHPAKPKEYAAAQLPAKQKEDAAAQLPEKPKKDAATQLPGKPKEDAVAQFAGKPKKDAAAQLPGKLMEDAAALRIQTAFRRYLARRALCALRGLASLKIVMQGPYIKHQTTNTYKSMKSLARIQSQVRARRLGVPEDNQTQRGQILGNKAKAHEKLENLQLNENGWDASPKSKGQIDARLHNKHEASIRRERAQAYSLNQQQAWRNSPTSKTAHTRFMDLKNNYSGWSWLERWLAARPWETASDPDNPDNALLRTSISGSQIAKAILQHVSVRQASASSSPRSISSSPIAVQQRRTSTGRLSTSTPSKARLSSHTTKPTSPKAIPRRSLCCLDDEDTKSNAESSVGGDDNDEDLATSPAAQAVPSYMVPTESARAKSRLGSILTADNKNEGMDRLSVCSAKKRSSSPTRSRNSVSSITDAISLAEQQNLINAM